MSGSGTSSEFAESSRPGDAMSGSSGVDDSNTKVLRDLCSEFHFRCRDSRCMKTLVFKEGDEHVDSWRSTAQQIPPSTQLSQLTCSCGTTTCAGCGNEPHFSKDNVFTPLGVINTCCSKGRLFSIWAILCRFDEKALPLSVESGGSNASSKNPKKKPVAKGSHLASGVGYASEYGQYYESFSNFDDMVLPAAGTAMSFAGPNVAQVESQKLQDLRVIETLKIIGGLLPSAEASPLEERSLFRLSLLFDRLTELVRNDSIIDLVERRDLYIDVVQFMKTIASRPELVGLLIEGRSTKTNNPGIRKIGLPSEQDNSSAPFSFAFMAGGPSILNASTNTYRQIKTFNKLSNTSDSSATGEVYSKVASTLFKDFIDLHEDLEKQLPTNGVATNGIADNAWQTYMEENRVTFTDEVLRNHRYKFEFDSREFSPAKGRQNTISKEIATMTTSLPAGIFLKVAESRMDVMKVLMVGSEGSPYAGGLFIFDLYLDSNYPTTPPKMQFTSEGNDNELETFNPNFHRGGNVCLSLLNTWHGTPSEMWQPNKSTILSVLISIQAMILGAPLPWLNEPGVEDYPPRPGNKLDSIVLDNKLRTQSMTLRHAMIHWIKNDFKSHDAKEHIWKEVSDMYWKYNAQQAFNYVLEWAEENPDLRDYNKERERERIGMGMAHMAHSKSKRKGKGRASKTNETSEDLVLELANLLKIPFPTEPEASSPMKEEDVDEKDHKRKASMGSSAMSPTLAHIPKKPKTEKDGIGATMKKWVYNGEKTQKGIRAACKEFGISYASTIKDSITKLQNHVNEKGKASKDMVSKWGAFLSGEDNGDEEESAEEEAKVKTFSKLPAKASKH